MSLSHPLIAMEPLITMANVTLSLAGRSGTVHILHDIGFLVAPGEALGIVGPSGSGKSSLLGLLGGIERSSSGSLMVAGQPLHQLGEEALTRFRRDTVGIIFQSFHLIPTMTARENAAIPLELRGDGQAGAKAADALEAVGLGHRLDHYPAELSGGEQQRVAIARALIGRPRLLLADEPTGNLDSQTGAQIIDMLFDLRRAAGATLVLVTHDPDLARRCDRTVRIQDGRIAEAAS